MPRVIAGAAPKEHGWWQRESSSSGLVNSATRPKKFGQSCEIICAPSLFRAYSYTQQIDDAKSIIANRPASDAVRVRLETHELARAPRPAGPAPQASLRTDTMKVSE
jgi:hypothetical protein